MTLNNAATRLAEAQVIAVAVAIANEAGWSIDRHAPLLAKEFWNYLHIPAAQLLLVPTIDHRHGVRFVVNRATREARSDALIVAIGGASPITRQVFASIALWGRESTSWFGPHVPWCAQDGAMWLVPEENGGIDDEPSFALNGDRLREGAAPWESTEDRARGVRAATALLNVAIPGALA